MRYSLFILILVLTICPAMADVQVYASKNLPKGTIITASDLQIEQIEETESQIQIADYIGKETRHHIYKGSSISPTDLGPVTVIKRNVIVSVRLRSPALEISLRGRTLDEGGIGDTIRIMNLDSRKIFTAIVISAEEVEVVRV